MKTTEKKNYYVTTPIYYVSGNPHIGTLYSTVLADVVARWHTLRGYDTYFLTGTDEHGQKIAEAAAKAGKNPQEFVDGFVRNYKQTWKDFAIDYSKFIRTTDGEHKKAVAAFIERLKKNGDIYKGEYAGWYCVPDETFVPGKPSADGQGPVCPSCGRATIYMSEESYFFKLSAYQERLLAFYKQNPDFITPRERLNEIISFVESGLKDLCVSRSSISWGIPFPGDPEQVVYVWLDALTNYISAIGYGDPKHQDEFNYRWPADVHIMAKDIVRFHAIYWPAFLMSAGLPLPKKLLVHGWITVDGKKMSKSFGNVVDSRELLELYGADPVRYYLTSRISVAQDGDFSFKDFEHTITQDLANELGNLANRVAVLAHKYNCASLDPIQARLAQTHELHVAYEQMREQVLVHVAAYSYHMACAEIKRFIAHVNAYMHSLQPWTLAERDKESFVEIIATVAGSLYAVAHMLWPVMPTKMEQLLSMLGKKFTVADASLVSLAPWQQPFVLAKGTVLFEKVDGRRDEAKMPAVQAQPQIPDITIQDFARVHLVAGTVLQADLVEKSDKLLKLLVDGGSYGVRQILSGIRSYYMPQDLIGKQAVFVMNLPPRTMMGLESQGMMLIVGGKFVQPEEPVANGTRLS